MGSFLRRMSFLDFYHRKSCHVWEIVLFMLWIPKGHEALVHIFVRVEKLLSIMISSYSSAFRWSEHPPVRAHTHTQALQSPFKGLWFFSPFTRWNQYSSYVKKPTWGHNSHLIFVSWEPEGRYQCSKMFRWEPEKCYWGAMSMGIASFWFSMEHALLVLNSDSALLALNWHFLLQEICDNIVGHAWF